jgi:hypothetical protein
MDSRKVRFFLALLYFASLASTNFVVTARSIDDVPVQEVENLEVEGVVYYEEGQNLLDGSSTSEDDPTTDISITSPDDSSSPLTSENPSSPVPTDGPSSPVPTDGPSSPVPTDDPSSTVTTKKPDPTEKTTTPGSGSGASGLPSTLIATLSISILVSLLRQFC